MASILLLVSVVSCSSASGEPEPRHSPDAAASQDGTSPQDGKTGDGGAGDADRLDAAIDQQLADGNTPCVPSVTAEIAPNPPTRETGVDAIVELTPACPDWAKHWTWIGPSGQTIDDAPHIDAIAKGETWTLDAWADGPNPSTVPHVAIEFTVDNAAPGAGVLAVVPDMPLPGEELSAVVTTPPQDVDGDDLTVEYTWYLDGTAAGVETANVGEGVTAAHETWKVVARAVESADADSVGPEFSAEAQVDALPPTAPEIAIVPDAPLPGDPLQAVITQDATDPNGDALTYVYAWTRNQVLTAVTTPSVSGSQVQPHDTWSVEVRAKSAWKLGPPASATAMVQNQAPIVQSVGLSPLPFHAGTGVDAIVAGVADPDGDATTETLRWSVNGVVQSAYVDMHLPGSAFKRGDVVSVRVEVEDNHGGVATADSSAETASNAPPSPPANPRFDPPFPRGADAASVVVQTLADLDGDPVSLLVEWFADGVSSGVGTDVTRTVSQLSGPVWTAKVASTDGIDTSAYVPVPGSLHTCSALTPRNVLTLDFYQGPVYTVWDPRACAVNVFTSEYTGYAVDPETNQIVQQTLSQVPAGPEDVLDLKAGLFGQAYIGQYDNLMHVKIRTPPYIGSSSSGVVQNMPLPADYEDGGFRGAAAVKDANGHKVIYALLDYRTTSQSRVRRLMMRDLTDTSSASDIDVGLLPDLTNARRGFYHAPTSELVIGPMTPTSFEMWAVHVETGATRLVRTDPFSVGWQYDVWTQKCRAYVPYKGYGIGELDPGTGQVTWHEPANGFQFETALSTPDTWGTSGRPPASVPTTSDLFAIYEDQGIVRFESQVDAIVDVTAPVDYMYWTFDQKHDPFDVVARSATGTVLVVGMGTDAIMSMARMYELDPTTGTVTWLTPEGGEPPRWVRDPAITYRASTDSLWVHGGVIRERVGVGETWRFDLVARQWSRFAVNGPDRVQGTLMADEAHNRLLFYGGRKPPLYPEPDWSNDVWALDLATGTWSQLFGGGGVNAPANLWFARAAIDLAGEQLFVMGGWYTCTPCLPNEGIHQRDLTTGAWLPRRDVDTSAVQPASTHYFNGLGGSSGYQSILREDRAQRVFLFAGRGCIGTQVLGYGLMQLPWDGPQPAWSFAIEDPAVGQYMGHLAYDSIQQVAHSVWAEVGDTGTICHDYNGTGSAADVSWAYP